LVRGLPTLAFHGINSDSARNYQLIDMENTEEWVFCRELPPQGQEIHLRNIILPGITSSWKLIQTGKIKICK
jgi:hypothetical protein